jgi:hypothetical protein
MVMPLTHVVKKRAQKARSGLLHPASGVHELQVAGVFVFGPVVSLRSTNRLERFKKYYSRLLDK